MRRTLHGRDVEDPQSRKDGADPGFARRLFARIEHYRRRRTIAAPALPRCACRRLCQHVRRREGGGRHLLHLVERGRSGGEPGRADRNLPPRSISGALRRLEDEREDHRLERRLRSARALHRRRTARLSRGRPVRADHCASRMPARRAGGSRLHRLDRAHDQMGSRQAAEAAGDDHGMLDGGQSSRRVARCGDGAALQSLPAHEADHAAEDSREPALSARGGHGRSRDRGTRAALGRADDQSEELRSANMASTDLSRSDVVIVGGGLAGLFCALKLAPRPVTVISAAPPGQGASSAWAQGGIAAAVAEGDGPEAHAADTIAAGAGLVDEHIALGLAREAAARIDDLLRYGVPFDRDLEGRLAVGREAAHSARRIVHVRGDMAGAAIFAALTEAVRNTPSIRLIEGFVAENLLSENGAVTGLQIRDAHDPLASPIVLASRAIVLATGGIGHLYAVTTNPAEAGGLGLALAARAGAIIADPEFVQFHPTAIMAGRDPAPLATEALRG